MKPHFDPNPNGKLPKRKLKEQGIKPTHENKKIRKIKESYFTHRIPEEKT